MLTDTELLAGLRAWAARHGGGVRAATELLIVHDHWLWDPDFPRRCVYSDGGLPAVNFGAVARYCDMRPAGSESQLAMLRVIADIGSGRWGLETMDGRNRMRVADAVALAVGIKAWIK